MSFLPGISLIRIAIYATIVLGLIGMGVYWEHSRMQKKLDAKVAEFNQFKGGVDALGREARKEALEKDLWNKILKEKTDEESRSRIAALKRDTDRLRADADRAREGFVSRLTAAARRANKAEEFRSEFERAYRELVQEVRAVGDDGVACMIDLDAAKGWAAKIK